MGIQKQFGQVLQLLNLPKLLNGPLIFDIKGLYHITNNTSINKFELKLFKKHTHKDIDINPIDTARLLIKAFLTQKAIVIIKSHHMK